MGLKEWIKHAVRFIVLSGYIICLGKILGNLNKDGSLSYTTLFYTAGLSFLIGIILALEPMIIEIKKSGTWKINIAKIVFCVLPLLFIASFDLIYYSDSFYWIYPNFLVGLFQYFIHDLYIVSIAQLLFGFTLLTSFYKRTISTNGSDSLKVE